MTIDFKVVDAVVNIWTAEALSHRPTWTDELMWVVESSAE